MLELAIGAIIVALIFDFVNGFNDSANSVATVIGTRVLKPLHRPLQILLDLSFLVLQ